MTLRTRLVLITAGLSALAVVAAGVAGAVLLRGYLVDRVDERFGPPVEAGRLAGLVDEGRGEGVLGDRFGEDSQVFLFDGRGRSLGSLPGPGAAAAGPELPAFAQLRERAGAAFTVPGRDGGDDWRVRAVASEDGGLVVTAFSLAGVNATVTRLLLIDAAVLGVVLLLLALGAAWMIRLGLRPLTRMEATAGAITGGDVARRVPGTDPRTEPGRLGLAMNAMLDRVESEITARRASEGRLRRFLSDASHELRTPLTTIRGFAELARRGGDPAEALARIEAEATRMGVLVEDLLLLARLDERPQLARAPVDLLELAADLTRDAHARAPGRTVTLAGLGPEPPAPVTVSGDALRLRQIVGNLLTNALRHTPPEATVTLRVGRTPDAAVVEVADTGPGIPPEHAPRIFDRLYRANPTPTDGGTGLGLPIATALARAHGGRVELTSTSAEGTTFRLTLP